jgi:hypothetical protein
MRKLALGLVALTLPLGIMVAVVTSGVAQATSPATTTSITGVSFSGSTAAPTVTVTGKGFGASPTGGVVTGTLSNCGNGTYNGDDYPAGQLWLVDATASGWSAGAAAGGGKGSCVGEDITSWSNKKVVFTFGNSYGQFNWSLSNNDLVVVSVKGVPGSGTVSGLS